MSAWRSRAKAERDQLFARMEALEAYLDSDHAELILDVQLRLLKAQFAAMGAYLAILDARLET